MTAEQYLSSSVQTTQLPVIDDQQQIVPGALAIVGFSTETERTGLMQELLHNTDSRVFPALFAATASGMHAELVPFSIVDDILNNPARLQDPDELFFELGRLYFPGLLAY